jgi:hypothetical protein
MPRRILGTKMDELREQFRMLRAEELGNIRKGRVKLSFGLIN